MENILYNVIVLEPFIHFSYVICDIMLNSKFSIRKNRKKMKIKTENENK